MSKVALVTGGAGFLGVPTILELVDSGWDVVCLDTLERTHARTEQFPRTNVVVRQVDVRDSDAVRAVIDEHQPTAIVHLAALHFIPYCEAHPTETLSVNVVGTQSLLTAVRGSSVRRLLFASTADTYQPSDTPHQELDPIAPMNIYGLSKVIGEQLIGFAQQQQPDLSATIVRLFNLYGPGETNPHVLPSIFHDMAAGDVLTLGALTPRRDYIYVGDAARALRALLESETSVDVVNVGTGSSASVAELVDILSRLTGRSLRIEQDPARMRPTDRPEMRANIDRLRATVPSFAPRELSDGLAETLRHLGLR